MPSLVGSEMCIRDSPWGARGYPNPNPLGDFGGLEVTLTFGGLEVTLTPTLWGTLGARGHPNPKPLGCSRSAGAVARLRRVLSKKANGRSRRQPRPIVNTLRPSDAYEREGKHSSSNRNNASDSNASTTIEGKRGCYDTTSSCVARVFLEGGVASRASRNQHTIDGEFLLYCTSPACLQPAPTADARQNRQCRATEGTISRRRCPLTRPRGASKSLG